MLLCNIYLVCCSALSGALWIVGSSCDHQRSRRHHAGTCLRQVLVWANHSGDLASAGAWEDELLQILQNHNFQACRSWPVAVVQREKWLHSWDWRRDCARQVLHACWQGRSLDTLWAFRGDRRGPFVWGSAGARSACGFRMEFAWRSCLRAVLTGWLQTAVLAPHGSEPLPGSSKEAGPAVLA